MYLYICVLTTISNISICKFRLGQLKFAIPMLGFLPDNSAINTLKGVLTSGAIEP